MAQSSCLNQRLKHNYDVFLSFRGADTRYSFTGNLYYALCQKGINTFIDEEELDRGEQISPAILKAIDESKISIIVFSKNFASSTWCLNELVKILDCMRERRQLVLPIFYKVEPSTIRYQRDSFGEAMTKHQERLKDDKDMVKKWRSALFEVSNLSGWEFKSGYEFEFIQKVIKEVSTKLNIKRLHIDHNLVGLESRMKEVNSILDIELDKATFMVGIYGSGGIGKTTLARFLYAVNVDQFECGCFLADVREISNKKGLFKLQEMLLAKTVGEKHVKLSDIYEGISIIQDRLHSKKVLLILDDVDNLEQLQRLAGECDWFGFGTRIIITTRNKHLFVAHQVERTYQMKELDDHEALELFSWNAFKMSHPPSSHLNISKSIVHYAKGLPLALKVIGSDLFGKTSYEWKCALDKYERIPNRELQKVLRISYDSLEENEKNIFLDIACFFRWEKLEDVEKILDACNFYPQFGIGVLVDKSLISIENGKLNMHDLIRDMGREIIRQSSPLEPGKRSRLWFHEDVLEVLTQDTGTENIEGIKLRLLEPKVVYWNGTAFKKMKNLRILVIENAIFSTSPKHLPNNLRFFEWREYPSKTLPPDFDPKKLVVFNLPSSYFTLDKPFKEFQFLIKMNFRDCHLLTQIPDISGALNLQYLYLSDCTNLLKVHESVGFLKRLVHLDASGCNKLKCFPRGIHLTSLEYLSFSDCRRLEFFPNILAKMEKLSEICFYGTSIKKLPDSFGSLTGLNYLNMEFCRHLRSLPSSLFMLPHLSELCMEDCPQLVKPLKQVGLINTSSLHTLTLGNCGLSDEDLPMIFRCFPNLDFLSLKGSNLRSLPTCIKEAVSLRVLSVDDCKKLREIPEISSNLQTIMARNCISLTSESSSTLLNQAFREVHKLQVRMPATKIPEWFDHRNKGEIISFWIRQKFPVVALAFSFKNLTKLENEILSQSIGTNLDVHIFINGIEVLSKFLIFPIVGGHLMLFDLQDIFNSEEWMRVEAFLLQDWNHVEVCCSNSQPELPKLTVEYYGVHVYKKETNMEDIRFHNPLNLSKRPASFSPQPGRPKKLIKKYKGAKDKGKDKLFKD